MNIDLNAKTIGGIVAIVMAVLGGNLGLERFAGGSATVTNPNRDLTPRMKRSLCRMIYMEDATARSACLDKYGDANGQPRFRGQ